MFALLLFGCKVAFLLFVFIAIKMTEQLNCSSGICLFKVNNGNARTKSEIFLKLTINTLVGHQCCSGFLIVNFEQISYNVAFIVDFEEVNGGWVRPLFYGKVTD